MIALATLANIVESGLNTNDNGLTFRIFADFGEYETATRKYNNVTHYINGVMISTTSGIQNTQGLEIAVQQVQLRLLVGVGEDENDTPPEGIAPDSIEYVRYLERLKVNKIAIVRRAVDAYLKNNMVQDIINDSGKTYNVTMVGALLSTGTAEVRGIVGESIELYATLNYSFLQNGLNSDDVVISLNGERLPYIIGTLTRSPAVEQNAFSNSSGNSRGIAASTAFGIDLTMPATNAPNGQNAASRAILDFILTGVEKTYNLTISVRDIASYEYTVIMGQTQVSLEEIKNAAFILSFVEAADYGGES